MAPMTTATSWERSNSGDIFLRGRLWEIEGSREAKITVEDGVVGFFPEGRLRGGAGRRIGGKAGRGLGRGVVGWVTMKMRMAMAVLCGAATMGQAENLRYDQAPRAVQQTLTASSGGNPIQSIDRRTQRGGNVYDARWTEDGVTQHLTVTEGGQIIGTPATVIAGAAVVTPGQPTGLDAGRNVTLANRTSVALADAPQAVRAAINAQILNAGIESMERGIWNGQNIYEVNYRENGQARTFQVTEAGRPVAGNPAGREWQLRHAGLAKENVRLSGGIKMELDRAPMEVRRTVSRMAVGAKIEDFEYGSWEGRGVYQAAFKRDGEHVELQVLEDGSLLTSAAEGSAVAGGRGGRGWRARHAGLADTNVPLSGSVKIDLGAAPREVQTTVTRMANGARIEDLERGQWNGRTVYEAGFKRNGSHTELQVLEDGTILTKAPAGAVGGPGTGVSGEGRRQDF